MTTINDLRTSINNLLATGSLPSTFVLRRNAIDAAYEAYIFTLILHAVRQIGGSVELRSINNPNRPPRTFIFRGSPGRIYSSLDDYGYALCSYNGHTFEVHVDVQYYGTSKVLHEIDISIVEHDEADRCRQNGTNPLAGKTKGALECKFYGNNLGTTLIRTFVGLTDDLGTLKISRFVTNHTSRTISKYCTGKTSRPRFMERLTPLNPDAENQFIYSVVDDLRKWLG